MKILAATSAIVFLLGLPNIAKAQNDGNPFKFTITGDFIDGEPDESYTASGGTAYITIGVAAVYTVENTDGVTRRSVPSFTARGTLGPAVGPSILPPPPPASQSASGSDDRELMPGQVMTYSLHFLTSGDVSVGTYTASAIFTITDNKTGDGRALTRDKSVTVH